METNYFFDVNEKFKKLILQCLDELKELNFPIPTSVYFREGTGLRIYGLCYSDKFYKKYKDYDFVISINKNLILEKDIKETIIHELLHTVDLASGHKGTWKFWANYINEKTEYNISRLSDCKLNSSAFYDQKQKELSDLENKLTVTCPICQDSFLLKKTAYFDKHGASSFLCEKCNMNYYKSLPYSPIKDFTNIEKENFVNNICHTTKLDEEFILNSLPFLNQSLRNKLIIELFVNKTDLFLSIKSIMFFILPILQTCDKNIKTHLADMYINNQVERLKTMTEHEFFGFSTLFSLNENYLRVQEHWHQYNKKRSNYYDDKPGNLL